MPDCPWVRRKVLLILLAAPLAVAGQESARPADRLVAAAVDHRRVANLQAFFQRAGAQLPVSRDPRVYRAGDLVTWMLPGNIPHVGVVIGEKSATDTPLVVHNIGRGPEVEDILFRYPITGHFRYRTE